MNKFFSFLTSESLKLESAERMLALVKVPFHCSNKLTKVSVRQICSENKEGNFMSNIPRTVDGVVLESRDERDEDCVITFQTESILEKFLLKFERLQMDCNDHLYIYDGAHVAGPWRVRLVTDHVLLSSSS